MTFVRDATTDDHAPLSDFECCSEERHPYEVEVEDVVRDVFGWRDREAPDACILVLEDYGELVGLLAYQPDGERSYFVAVLAIRRDRKREYLGERFFSAVLSELEQVHQPGACHVWWQVKLGNFPSHDFSNKMGADETFPPDTPGLVKYELWLGAN